MSNVANVSNNAACKVSVTCGSNPNLITGENCKCTRFIYNSSVNLRPANVRLVVYSSTYQANVNPTCDTVRNFKPPNASPVNANAVCDTQSNVKHTLVCESELASVKHICESLPNVKPVCSNNGADHGVNESMYNSFNVDQALPKGAQDESDSTAKAVSKLTYLQKHIPHSLSCHPVSPWYDPAMSSD